MVSADTLINDSGTTVVYDQELQCTRCSKPIHDNSVIQMGDAIWHMDCYCCSACDRLLDNFSTQLVIQGNQPLCGSCLPTCRQCSYSIYENAVMAGNDAYHMHCFRCCRCKSKIKDLVFTMSRKGLVCMSCDVAKKKAREKRRLERENRTNESVSSHEHKKSRKSIAPESEPVPKETDAFQLSSTMNPASNCHMDRACRSNSAGGISVQSSHLSSLESNDTFLSFLPDNTNLDHSRQITPSDHAPPEATSDRHIKEQLEHTCDELRQCRNNIFDEIMKGIIHGSPRLDANGQESLAAPLRQLLQCQLHSIVEDISQAQEQLKTLQEERDNVIREMVMLNIKNAELTAMNNELSRRITEREREATAFIAGSNFLDSKKKPRSKRTIFGKFGHKLEDHERPDKGDNTTSGSVTLVDASSLQLSTTDTDACVNLALRDHHFTASKFIRPTRCQVCNDKIWRGTETKCQDCGTVCHTKCLQNISTLCKKKASQSTPQPNVQKSSPIPLKRIDEYAQSDTLPIPLIVQKCIEAIETRDLDYEGIYRKSGGAKQIIQIQQAFLENHPPDLLDVDQWNDFCAITSVLKQFFQKLEAPLFTYEHHSEFLKALDIVDVGEKKARFKHLLCEALPTINRETIRYLMHHLDKVHEHRHKNLMSHRNLAVIFGPTLLRNRDESVDLQEMSQKIETIYYILIHLKELF